LKTANRQAVIGAEFEQEPVRLNPHSFVGTS
jgi:hypothetical protein